jgi:hypothetical protein
MLLRLVGMLADRWQEYGPCQRQNQVPAEYIVVCVAGSLGLVTQQPAGPVRVARQSEVYSTVEYTRWSTAHALDQAMLTVTKPPRAVCAADDMVVVLACMDIVHSKGSWCSHSRYQLLSDITNALTSASLCHGSCLDLLNYGVYG